MSKVKNDPGFIFENPNTSPQSHREKQGRTAPTRPVIAARKTEIATGASSDTGPDKLCPLHKTKHALNKCKVFRTKPIEERRKFLKEKKICFRCCESDQHVRKSCKVDVRCETCESNSHASAMHIDTSTLNRTVPPKGLPNYGGESGPPVTVPESVSANCMQIGRDEFGGKSCAKNIVVRVYHENDPHKAKTMYAIVDDQSNKTLIKSDFFTIFDIKS